MQKLEINDNEILLSNQVVTISKRAYDFTDLTTRNIDITNRINLDNTPEIREALEHPEIIHANNNSFEKFYPAKLFDNTLLFQGVAQIQEVTRKKISVQLIDSFKEVLEILKNDLNKLSIDSYDFEFSLANYNALRQLTTSVWVWPVCNMRADKTGIPTLGSVTLAELKYSRPMFSVKILLDLMFSENGWTFDRDNILAIDNHLLTSNHESFYVSSYLKTFDDTFNISGTGYLTDFTSYDFQASEVSSTSNSFTINGRKTSIRLRGTISANANFQIQVEYGSEKQTFTINQNQTYLDLETNDFENASPQIVRINIVGTVDLTLTDFRVYSLIEETEFGDLSTNPLSGFWVVTYENLPDISQYNIFKNSLIHYNAFLQTDILKKTITANKIGDLNKLNREDWSDKFIQESEEITNESLTLYKANYIGFSNDNTLNAYKGSYLFNIDSEIYEDSGFVLQLDYSASNDLISQSESMADLPIYGLEDTDETRLNDLDLRVLYYKEVGSDSVAYFSELDFNNLIDDYFNNLLTSLLRPRVIDCYFELKKLDVLGFDFTKLVFVDEFKSCFYVLAIEDYEPASLTKVKLIKF